MSDESGPDDVSSRHRVKVIHVPWGKDLTEFHQQKGDIHSWLARELRQVRMNALGELKGA